MHSFLEIVGSILRVILIELRVILIEHWEALPGFFVLAERFAKSGFLRKRLTIQQVSGFTVTERYDVKSMHSPEMHGFYADINGTIKEWKAKFEYIVTNESTKPATIVQMQYLVTNGQKKPFQSILERSFIEEYDLKTRERVKTLQSTTRQANSYGKKFLPKDIDYIVLAKGESLGRRVLIHASFGTAAGAGAPRTLPNTFRIVIVTADGKQHQKTLRLEEVEYFTGHFEEVQVDEG